MTDTQPTSEPTTPHSRRTVRQWIGQHRLLVAVLAPLLVLNAVGLVGWVHAKADQHAIEQEARDYHAAHTAQIEADSFPTIGSAVSDWPEDRHLQAPAFYSIHSAHGRVYVLATDQDGTQYVRHISIDFTAPLAPESATDALTATGLLPADAVEDPTLTAGHTNPGCTFTVFHSATVEHEFPGYAIRVQGFTTRANDRDLTGFDLTVQKMDRLATASAAC
jgi:hypothetical protein